MSLRTGIRIFFLVMIFVLWFTGFIEVWGTLLGLSLLLLPFLGRIYCGWACPISTTIDALKTVNDKSVFRPDKKYFPNVFVQILIVALSFFIMRTLLVNDFVVPFFILLIPVGLIVTVLFGEEFWHRYCFIGIIYSWIGRFSRVGYYINQDECTECNVCVDNCSSACILDDYVVDKRHCLYCNKCKENCPVGAVKYGRRADLSQSDLS
ncbi:MAG TPA: 4Fe-4S binding protein [Clostridia bacterium]|nr:4Fe-4S binding protein [Clostridia bacterium]